jgi:hypothetical protein
LTGTDLVGSGNITVSAAIPEFQVSLTPGSGFGPSLLVPFTGPVLAPVSVYVRCTPSAAGIDYSSFISHSGGGDLMNLPVTGSSNIFSAYCPSGANTIYNEEILSVTLNGHENVSNCSTVAPGPGSLLNRYSNFFPLGSLATLPEGDPVFFSIRQENCNGSNQFPNGCAIWIDLNQDGDFLDANEKVFAEDTTTIGPRDITGSFIIPSGTPVGHTAMRVTVAYALSGASLTPCLFYDYGETEDYRITIGPAPTCPAPRNLAVANLTNQSADIGWTAGGIETGWEYAIGESPVTMPAGPGIFTTLNPGTVTGLNPDTRYDFYVRAVCGGPDG